MSSENFDGKWRESLLQFFSSRGRMVILLGALLLCGALIWIFQMRPTGGLVDQPGESINDLNNDPNNPVDAQEPSPEINCPSLSLSPKNPFGIDLKCSLMGIQEGTFFVIIDGAIIWDQPFQGGSFFIDLTRLPPPNKPFVIQVTGKEGQQTSTNCGMDVDPDPNDPNKISVTVNCQNPNGESQANLTQTLPPLSLSCDGQQDGGIHCDTNVPQGVVTVTGQDNQVLLEPQPFVAENGMFSLNPSDLPPGVVTLKIRVQDLWGRATETTIEIVVLPRVEDPTDDPVSCESGDPASEPLPPHADIISVVVLLFPPESGIPSRVYLILRAPVPSGEYFFGGIAPADDPFNPLVGITADSNRVDTYNALQGYWVTNQVLVVLLTPDFAQRWAQGELFTVLSDNGPCDQTAPIEVLQIDPKRIPESNTVLFQDPEGDLFNRATGEPVQDGPEVDIRSISLQRSPDGKLVVIVNTGAPFPEGWYSRAIEIRIISSSTNQSCLWQVHNGTPTLEGNPSHQGTTTTCIFIFQTVDFPWEVQVNTFGMETPNSLWLGDTFMVKFDNVDWFLLENIHPTQGP